ncbi:MAG: hypothetical protein HOV66_25005 [Streptomycetaceae bacterium]|nr:hypothetical protein [Streptomycetaceae bacterium]
MARLFGVVLLLALLIPGAAHARPTDAGITVVSMRQAADRADGRMVDAVLTTDAIFAGGARVPVTVRIYLPAGYRPGTAKRYPVLYLLHGGAGAFSDWSVNGDVAGVIAKAHSGFDGIVVMPEGGRSGWYSDWPGRTDGGFAPHWETFHVAQLVPWVDATFATIADRRGRAIAGPSMGGLGTLHYAARHPEAFGLVGAMSAGTDLRLDWAQDIISNSGWQSGASIGLTGLADGAYRVNRYAGGALDVDQHHQKLYRLDTVLGPHTTVGGRYDWPAANPTALAQRGAYRPYANRLVLYAGGCEGRAPCSPTDGETGIGAANLAFHTLLTSSGVPHRYCTNAAGHVWPAWQADLADFLRFAYGPATHAPTMPCWS